MEKESLFATEALANARRELGLTQAEMADLLTVKLGKSVSIALYKAWELGTRSIATKIAVLVSRELKTPIKVLFRKDKGNGERKTKVDNR